MHLRSKADVTSVKTADGVNVINNTKLIMEDLTMTEREYKCAVCETWHPDIISRAKCEIACMEKKAEEERKAVEAKKAAEQKMRKEAVDEAIQNAAKLQREYVKDYGYYEYEGELVENIFLPSKLWHHVLF